MLAGGPVQVANRIEADVVWMDERPLNPSRMYLLSTTPERSRRKWTAGSH